MDGCDTCAKRGPWRRESRGPATWIIADCSHRPLPPFWGSIGTVQVMPGCGSECRHFIVAKARAPHGA